MKVPPKRKGNRREMNALDYTINALNESPSEKEGKLGAVRLPVTEVKPLNESPSEKEGKYVRGAATIFTSTKPQ